MAKPKTPDSETPESQMDEEAAMTPEDYDISSILREEDDDVSELQPVELNEDAAELLHQIEKERDEAVESRQRALADFANFQRRSAENERQSHKRGEAGVVKSLIPVLDDFDLALGQPPEQMTVEQLLNGVRIVRDSIQRALESHGVTQIAPEAGDEFDPNRHEAMLKQPSADIAPDHIVSVMQIGYAIGDLVLRPAKVALAESEGDAGESKARGSGLVEEALDFSDLDDLEL